MSSSARDAAIRPARADDLPRIEDCVREAYSVYLDRMDGPPAPMSADYAALLDAGAVHVLEEDGQFAGLIVLFPREDHLFVENIAVLPRFQGRGIGIRSLRFAEEEARRARLAEVRFYTHEVMTENIAYYGRRGYEETGRREEDGYRRVYFRKRVGPG